MSVHDKVKSIVAAQLRVAKDEVTLEASFIENLGADSLDIVQLLMAFLAEFDVEIPDEDLKNIVTVGDAIHYIETHSPGS